MSDQSNVKNSNPVELSH